MPNYQTVEYYQQILNACKKSDLNKIKDLFNNHDFSQKYKNDINIFKDEILNILVDKKNLQALTFLFNDIKVNINDIDKNNKIKSNILHYALKKTNFKVVEYLLNSEELIEHASIKNDHTILESLFLETKNKKEKLKILKYFVESGDFGKYHGWGNDIPNEEDLFHSEIDMGYFPNDKYIDFNHIFNNTNFLFHLIHQNHLPFLQYVCETPYTSRFININIKHSTLNLNLALYASRLGFSDIIKYVITSENLSKNTNIYSEDNQKDDILMRLIELDVLPALKRRGFLFYKVVNFISKSPTSWRVELALIFRSFVRHCSIVLSVWSLPFSELMLDNKTSLYASLWLFALFSLRL